VKRGGEVFQAPWQLTASAGLQSQQPLLHQAEFQHAASGPNTGLLCVMRAVCVCLCVVW
jgi:hypothetical protein